MSTDVFSFTAGGTQFILYLTFDGSATSGAIQSISGFVGSDVITQIDASYQGADNQFSTSPLYVDYNGLAFDTANSQFNLYNINGTDVIINTGSLINAPISNVTLVVCYCRGTRVLTERGEVTVEDLAVGERVVTLSGQGPVLKPIKWLGRRRVEAKRHRQPDSIYPVRIAASSIAENVPHRDLLVSPGHAILIDGVLIPAERLVNGITITQDRSAGTIDYFHVELDSHDILLAEGLPAESYLDSGNRDFFENGGMPVALHGAPERCIPLIARDPAVIAIKNRLAERALKLASRLVPMKREV